MLPPLPARSLIYTKSLSLLVYEGPIEMFLNHGFSMGQIVPTVKDNMSRDSNFALRHNRTMDLWLDEAQFNDEICARIQRLREEREWNQRQMAAAIGVPFERYKKYETRSPMPPYLIPRFAQIVDRSMSYILTGRDEMMAKPKIRRLVRTGSDG